MIFKRNNRSLEFYILLDNSDDTRKYSKLRKLITENGGKISSSRDPPVITFTDRKNYTGQEPVFQIDYIYKCIEYGKLLDLMAFKIGDPGHYGCLMTLFIYGTNTCPSTYDRKLSFTSTPLNQNHEHNYSQQDDNASSDVGSPELIFGQEVSEIISDTSQHDSDSLSDKTLHDSNFLPDETLEDANFLHNESAQNSDKDYLEKKKIYEPFIIIKEENNTKTDPELNIVITSSCKNKNDRTLIEVKELQRQRSPVFKIRSIKKETELKKEIENESKISKSDIEKKVLSKEQKLADPFEKKLSKDMEEFKIVKNSDRRDKDLNISSAENVISIRDKNSNISKVGVASSSSNVSAVETAFPKVEVKKPSTNVKKKKNYFSIRRNIQPWEQRAMVKYLIDNNAISLARGNNIWKQMIEDNEDISRRTYLSLNNHFRKFILPKINKFDMTEEDMNEFKKLNQSL